MQGLDGDGAGAAAPTRAALMLAALLVAAPGLAAAQQEEGWRTVDPDRFAIVSRFAAFSEPPEAMPGVNRLGGQSITVRFRYEGGAFALVVYNESPVKLSQPSMVVATQQALSSSPLFKDGDFEPGEIGSADSPLGPFTYQLVHERRPAGEGPLLSCAVYQHLRPSGRTALTGFFCAPGEDFSPDTVNAFFATLGIRGIAMPQ